MNCISRSAVFIRMGDIMREFAKGLRLLPMLLVAIIGIMKIEQLTLALQVVVAVSSLIIIVLFIYNFYIQIKNYITHNNKWSK